MLDSLRVFRLVAQTSSFTEAARLASLTRPAVSQHVRKLEQRFGTRLLARTTRRVQLTPAGRVLLEHANRVLDAMSALEDAMAALERAAARTLVVGASTLPGECLVPQALATLRAERPDVDVQVRVGDSDTVLAWVRNDQVAMGLVGLQPDGADLVVECFGRDEIVLVFPPGVAVPPSVTLRELRHLPLILRERGSATRATVLAALAEAGIGEQELHIVAELGSPGAVMNALRHRMGAAFLSALCLPPGEFPWTRVQGLSLARPLCAAWRRDRPLPELGRILLNHLRERPATAAAMDAATAVAAPRPFPAGGFAPAVEDGLPRDRAPLA